MTALHWLWTRRNRWPLASVVIACLVCIQFAATPLGVLIVVLSPVVTAMAVVAIEELAAWRLERRHERAVIRSIQLHPSNRKGHQPTWR